MGSVRLLALCAFLAVSSATLLIYLAFTKAFGRARAPGDDLSDPEHDAFPGPAPFKPPVTKPLGAAPPMTGSVGTGLGIVAPIAVVVVAVLVVGVLFAARLMVRWRFEQVVARITSDPQPATEFDRNTSKLPDFRGEPFPLLRTGGTNEETRLRQRGRK
jgi:hypothetical protein